MSSSDGYCSALTFAPGELGQVYTGPVPPLLLSHQNPTLSAIAPPPTPIQPSPVRPKPTILASPVMCQSVPAPPASPARTSSAGSIATPSPAHPSTTANVINNPTPTLGSVPLVTAANSPQPPTLPLTTSPPQTPMSAVSRPSSVSGSALGKRDIQTTSESDKEEGMDKGLDQPAAASLPKKRRVAPTLISGANDGSSPKPDGAG